MTDLGLIIAIMAVLFFNNLEEVVKIYQSEFTYVMCVDEDWWVVIVINHMYERVLDAVTRRRVVWNTAYSYSSSITCFGFAGRDVNVIGTSE